MMPDSFQNPVGGNKPSDPYENYRVEEIQKDRDRKERPSPSSEKPFLAAFILHAIKKFFELFERGREEKPLTYTAIDLKEHLQQMKELFERLKIEDHSQDASFLQKLSNLWAFLLDDALQFPRKSLIAEQMHTLVHSIQDYPKGQEHSLGYYLSEYAGQKWMPFPYMEIIQGLWSDYQKNIEESQLAMWCRDLDKMVGSLD